MRNVLILHVLLMFPAAVLAQTKSAPAELQTLCVTLLLLTPVTLIVTLAIYLNHRKQQKAEAARRAAEAERRKALIREELKKNLPKATNLDLLQVPGEDEDSLHYLTYLFFKIKKDDQEEGKAKE